MCLTDVPANRVAIEKPADYDEKQYELLFRAIEAGQALGRSVARFTMRADRSGHSVLTPDADHERHGGR